MNIETKLNQFLANQIVLYTKLHNLHWYVKGENFFTLHERYEELYDRTTQILDEIAERMLAINLKPVGSLRGALKIATIKELEDIKISGSESVRVLKADLELLTNDAKQLKELTGEAGDSSSEDIFIGLIAEYEKTLWMLNAYLD